MGWVVAAVLAPILFALAAVYIVFRLALLLLRIAFIPLMLLRWRV